ncbi:hypothetical protein BJ138DRAFT_1115485 [Hygrophoropsis aurantiaca]|uniref:Uncharacterized protein n=1 Tax=Hygrophoropsis aurantiaca TaxID=72124 RepID=A0ACB8A721_9AGAM|nr:hypothetical protein BJ138DRAFT_1115485 [Hygrophoropsis aurantiaca]
MFKKPLGNIKTSAPLRSSDRRKLKQRIVNAFSLSSEDGDLLVPEGIMSIKFSTHLDEPGVAYLAPDGDPLWFTIGKGEADLIPTVYTLWKKPTLLPFLSTPSAVIPVLIGGADLMIPGVVQHMPALVQAQLVTVTQYTRDHNSVGPPLAVGRMAVNGAALSQEGAKGKAVNILHTWKDNLFEMGKKSDPPEAIIITENPQVSSEEHGSRENGDEDEPKGGIPEATSSTSQDAPAESLEPSGPPLSKEEVSSILHSSLLQAIRTSLSSVSPSAYPIPASTFYSSHILPSRPAFFSPTPSTPVDIKHSSHKSLTAFLKSAEKDGLLKLKDMKFDVLVLGVIPKHKDVEAHRVYTSLRDVELKNEKRENREEEERTKVKELVVRELWKPHQQSMKFFADGGFDASALYTLQEIKSTINKYVTDRQLINARDQAYINVDDLLLTVISSKSDAPASTEFIRRDELIKRLSDKMQNWYEIQADGKDPVLKKGQLKPISVIVKIRQGRKASTLITNFEPFFLVADELAEALRRLCASATSVSPMQGKNAGLEVLVQGKQIKAVSDLLLSRGVPKKWIESADQSGGKK